METAAENRQDLHIPAAAVVLMGDQQALHIQEAAVIRLIPAEVVLIIKRPGAEKNKRNERADRVRQRRIFRNL